MNVSIIIPAHNSAETLADTLESVRAQTFANWEAIIIDDGSSDATAEIAASFAAQDARFQWVSQPQSGVSAARNAGIRKARFDWLLFLDADDWILPSHLERLTAVLQRDSALDGVYCGWSRVTPEGHFIDQQFSAQPHELFAVLSRNCTFAIHSCVVRRAIVVEVGGFDASLRVCEDWDLWQRVARWGARFAAVSEPLACYRMRAHSASLDLQQYLTDGLTVIARGHAADSRVANPAPAYANGVPSKDLPGAKLSFIGWMAGLTLGQGGDPLPLLALVSQEQDPGLSPEIMAQSIFWSAFLPTCRLPSDWDGIWEQIKAPLHTFLSAIETQSLAPQFAQRVYTRLEPLILSHSTAPRPCQIGSTYAVRVEVTQPIPTIKTDSTAERLHCVVELEGQPIGTLTLPLCDGAMPSYLLKDAIAAQFAWVILERFFQRTLYPTFTTRQTADGWSIWRSNLCLASDIPADEPLEAVLHNRIGWTVFLQELWGRPDWLDNLFYNAHYQPSLWREVKASVRHLLAGKVVLPKAQVAAPRRRADKGWISVELSQELPDVQVDQPELQVIPRVGGVALGRVAVKVKNGVVRAAVLRAAIIQACGFELVIAAVREGLLGHPCLSTLRSRLAACPVASAPGERHTLENAEGLVFAPEFQTDLGHVPTAGATMVLARHAANRIGTSGSRRAMFPVATAADLAETAALAGSPVVRLPDATLPPTQVIYAPDLLWYRLTAPAESAGPSSSASRSATVYGRNFFETLFATQPDPWKYTNAYEQTKYEQTLGLLPDGVFNEALELACAEGHFTVQLAPRVKQLLATDISQIALDRTAERCAEHKQIHFQLLDLTQDAIPGSFDLIVCSEVLYYVGGLPELQAVAQKIAAALKPGGYFLTAHANLVVDEPDCPGYNWDHPFGAKVIGETFAHLPSLQPVKELRTPLYRIHLFQRLPVTSPASPESPASPASPRPTSPEVIEMPQPTPPPERVASTVLWQGGSPQFWSPEPIVTSQLPILMYHRVAPTGAAAMARYRVTPDAFEQQLQFLRDGGFYSVSLADWQTALRTKKPLPGRAILLTFDDGYQDFLTYALPLLQRYGFSALVFLATDKVGHTNDWDQFYGEAVPLLNWQEVRELQQAGIEFGSHAASHRPLTGLSIAEIVQEGARSRAMIQRQLGFTPKTFAYPYGDRDAVVQQLIGACGYELGFSCISGLCSLQADPLALPRIEVTGFDQLQAFVAKLRMPN